MPTTAPTSFAVNKIVIAIKQNKDDDNKRRQHKCQESVCAEDIFSHLSKIYLALILEHIISALITQFLSRYIMPQILYI